MPSRSIATRTVRSAAASPSWVAALTLIACLSRPTEKKTPPSASAPPQPATSQVGSRGAPGREVALVLSGNSFDEAWEEVEAALVKTDAPIDSLAIDAFAAPFGDEGVRRLLARQPQLAPIQLTLSNAKLTPAGLSALLASAVPSRLELLDLRDNLLGAAGARLLAESMRLTSLRQLNLGRNHLHAYGAAALAGTRGLSSLRRLELEYNFIGYEGARALAESANLPNLRDLGLAYNFLGDSGAEYLAGAAPPGTPPSAGKNWPALELLDVSGDEIGPAGALALGASTTLSPRATIWFNSNLEDRELERLGLAQRLLVVGSRERDGRATLGELDVFARPKRHHLLTAARPPEDLPARIEFRELWIREFGLVAEFPTFMLPQRPPGNGKSRVFAWLDRATLSIGSYWLLPGRTVAEELASWTDAGPSEEIRVERPNSHTVLVYRGQGTQERVVRAQTGYGAVFYVDFAYPAELSPYFAPLAAHVVASLYFARAHLK